MFTNTEERIACDNAHFDLCIYAYKVCSTLRFVLLDFLLTVKAKPHICVIRTSQHQAYV